MRLWANQDRSVVVLEDDGDSYVFNRESGWRPQREAYSDVLARMWDLDEVDPAVLRSLPDPCDICRLRGCLGQCIG